MAGRANDDDQNAEGEGRLPSEAGADANGKVSNSLVARLEAIVGSEREVADLFPSARVAPRLGNSTDHRGNGHAEDVIADSDAKPLVVHQLEPPETSSHQAPGGGNSEIFEKATDSGKEQEAIPQNGPTSGFGSQPTNAFPTAIDAGTAEQTGENASAGLKPEPLESPVSSDEGALHEGKPDDPSGSNGARHAASQANGSTNGTGHVNGNGADEAADAKNEAKASSGKNGSNSSNGINGGGRHVNGGGGSNGAGGYTPIERRFRDQDFREVLGKGLATCRRNLITVGIFSFIVNILVLAIPIYLFNISDRVLTSQSTDTLLMLTIIVGGAILMHVLLDMSRRFILMRIAVELESKLGAPVLSAAARASQNGSSREFQILGDLQHLRSFTTSPVLLAMFDAPAAPIYLLAVFLIHPHLGFIVCGTGLVLLFLAALNQKLTAVPFGRANAFATRANLQADAMARNAQVMNAMGMIPEGVLIWGRETAESLISQVVAQDRNILLAGASKLIRLCTQIGILGWGAWLAISGELTGGMIIAASIVGSRALTPIEGTIEGWRNFVQARSAYTRIKSLLQNSPLNFDRLRLPRPKGHLSVERVLYVPPPNKKVILNGVTFELEPGESLAIVGASGAGKSTLGKMLVGSVFPTAGNVRLDMMDLRNWDPRQFGESVGYLPQDVQLFPASIKENIARMRKDATDEAIFDAAELADVHGMISEFAQGYETQVAMDGSPLSGGQKQRIGLARAFFGDPRLVVLDEPNSNLDTPGEYALANALICAKRKEITVVAITQRPSLLRSVDKIMILKNGTVQAVGKRDDIIPLITSRNRSDGGALPNGGAALPET